MPPIRDISPGILKGRHRLSPYQINSLFGREVISETIDEKVNAIGKVGEFLRITDALSAASIPFIPLKGPLLSFRLYGDATVRKYGDIDLLVNSEEVEHARECLLAAGYSEYMTSWPSTASGKRKALKYWHHILFRKDDNEVIIELHWRLMDRQWLNFRDDGLLTRGNLESQEFQGRSYLVLKPEAELLYLVIHGSAHRWGMLKWLVDIQRYIETTDFDREQFYTMAEQFGCGRIVALCNQLLSGFFPGTALLPGGTTVSRYIEQAARGTINSPSNRGPESFLEIFRLLPYSMAVYPGLKYKLRVLSMVIGSSLFNGRLSRVFD